MGTIKDLNLISNVIRGVKKLVVERGEYVDELIGGGLSMNKKNEYHLTEQDFDIVVSLRELEGMSSKDRLKWTIMAFNKTVWCKL